MTTWMYFASEEKASLASTIGTVLDTQVLWRAARNSKGALIANVGNIATGDTIIVAWRHSGGERTAYLRCRIAAPLRPLEPGLLIERLSGTDAAELITAGYPEAAPGTVEGLRLDEIQECFFEVQGLYGGNNALHRLDPLHATAADAANAIPPTALLESPAPSGQRVSTGVDSLEIAATASARAFDAYAMIDWSSSSSPVRGNDSVWIASGSWKGSRFSADQPINYGTRAAAIAQLTRQLQQWHDEQKRVLVGFDFAFGYPSGFAAALGLPPSDAPWRAVHNHFAAHVTDSQNNAHNRDAFAEACNTRIGAPGPFWGCAGEGNSTLTRQRIGHFTFPHRGLLEWRVTDLEARRQVTTQSVWKLNCGVSVGGQTIVGLLHLDQLARVTKAHRWPFEGWGTPAAPGVWLAEIFPSLVCYPEWESDYRTRRDRTQVQSCLRRAAERDGSGVLRGDFDAPRGRLTASQLRQVQEEEGWMLWV